MRFQRLTLIVIILPRALPWAVTFRAFGAPIKNSAEAPHVLVQFLRKLTVCVTLQWRLKYCTARSCFSAAARVLKVPRFLRLPVFGSFLLE
jgi:hypothetical protein